MMTLKRSKHVAAIQYTHTWLYRLLLTALLCYQESEDPQFGKEPSALNSPYRYVTKLRTTINSRLG